MWTYWRRVSRGSVSIFLARHQSPANIILIDNQFAAEPGFNISIVSCCSSCQMPQTVNTILIDCVNRNRQSISDYLPEWKIDGIESSCHLRRRALGPAEKETTSSTKRIWLLTTTTKRSEIIYIPIRWLNASDWLRRLKIFFNLSSSFYEWNIFIRADVYKASLINYW